MSWMDDLVGYAVTRVDDRVRDALLDRGVSDSQMAQYGIGYLDNELPEGVPDEFRAWAAGKTKDVLLFPLTNAHGEVKGFQVRNVERGKSGYSDYLPDLHEACLFGLGQAAKPMSETRSAFIVEGAFDLFPIQRAFAPVVATLTARANPRFARLLKRVVDRVWVGYDMDAAGRRGCAGFARDHGGELEVYIVSYPTPGSVKDPGDLWEAWGDSRFIPFIQELTRAKDPLG
jgi:DNA primase